MLSHVTRRLQGCQSANAHWYSSMINPNIHGAMAYICAREPFGQDEYTNKE